MSFTQLASRTHFSAYSFRIHSISPNPQPFSITVQPSHAPSSALRSIVMASAWATFRKHWVRPEIYPLVGSLVGALGIGGYALFNKATDPTIPWNKVKRGQSIDAQLEGIEEVIPMWSTSSMRSIRIFTSANDIRDNKRAHNDFQDTFVVKVGDAEEEEEEEEEEEKEEEKVEMKEGEGAQPDEGDTAEEQPPAKAVEVPPPALNVMDEAAEEIHAAVDAALQTAGHTSNEPVATEVHKAVDAAMQSAVSTEEEPTTTSSAKESTGEEGKAEAA